MMDYSLCEGFFTEYCGANFSMKHIICDNLSENILRIAPDSPKIVSIVSPNAAAHYTCNRGQMFPDMLLKVTNSRIIQQEDRDNEESQIVSTFELEFTKIYLWMEEVDYDHESTPDDTQDIKRAVHNQIEENTNNLLASIKLEGSEDSEENPEQSSVMMLASESQSGRVGVLRAFSLDHQQAFLDQSPLLDEPMRVKLQGTITMSIDANKRITSFDYLYTSVDVPHGTDVITATGDTVKWISANMEECTNSC